MKNKFYIWLSIGILVLSIPALGQKTVVVVQPDVGISTGALNDAIKNASDPGNTIFELKRGGLYLLNGTISHTGYTLHVRAEAGDGPRPVLQPAVDQLGASARHFTPGGGIILEGLHLYGLDELGNPKDDHIRPAVNDAKFIFENCYFDYSNQCIIRVEGKNNYISFNNCIIRNSLRPNNPANGRHIDIRGNPTDTIIVTNCTLYNNGRDFIRMDNGFIQYLKWDHNTVYVMNFRGFEADRIPVPYTNFRIDLTYKALITNNLFYNVAYMQANYRHDALFSMDSIYTIGSFTDAGRSIDLSNNNWFVDPEIGEVLAEVEDKTIADGKYSRYYILPWSNGQDSIAWRHVPATNLFWNQTILDTATIYAEKPVIWHFIKNGQVDTSNIIREKLTFKNPCPLMLDYFRWYGTYNFDRFILETLTPPNAWVDEDTLLVGEVTTGAYDFSYNANSRSATAADGGLPLGDPRWVPTSTTSIDNLSALKARVRAFPNPFTDIVTFEFEIREHSSARINVYDFAGKEVYSVRMPVIQGKNSVRVDLGGIRNSGLYLYQIQFELSGRMKDICYGKFIKK